MLYLIQWLHTLIAISYKLPKTIIYIFHVQTHIVDNLLCLLWDEFETTNFSNIYLSLHEQMWMSSTKQSLSADLIIVLPSWPRNYDIRNIARASTVDHGHSLPVGQLEKIIVLVNNLSRIWLAPISLYQENYLIIALTGLLLFTTSDYPFDLIKPRWCRNS